jgi:hypothetical protein
MASVTRRGAPSRSRRRPPRTGSARARRSRRSARGDPGPHRQHVALLRLVAPDLERRHAGLGARHRAQLDAPPRRRRARSRAARSTGRRRRRRGSKRIGLSSPSAQQRSMTSWQRRSISALPRCTEAKSRSACSRPSAIDEAAPPPRPISIAGPPSTTSARAPTGSRPSRRAGADVAEAAGDHDRLVVAAHARPCHRALRFETCGNSRRFGRPNSLLNAAPPIGPSIMMSSAEAMRPACRDRDLPRLREPGHAQVRHEKPTRPALGLRAAAGRALVADLAAGAGGRAGIRRDRGRVVVRLDLHQDVHGLGVRGTRALPDRERSVRATCPAITAALSLSRPSTPWDRGLHVVLRIMPNRLVSAAPRHRPSSSR